MFAAGDVARHDHPVFGPIRVEHFDNALKMGETVARNMLGEGRVFDDPHWFWSDQYDVQIQMAGFAPTWDRMVVRGSLEDRSFCAFLLDADGRPAIERLDRVASRRPPVVRADQAAGASGPGRVGGSGRGPASTGPG